MTKDEMWAAYVKKHPKLGDDKTMIKISVGGIRRIAEAHFDAGADTWRDPMSKLQDLAGRVQDLTNPT